MQDEEKSCSWNQKKYINTCKFNQSANMRQKCSFLALYLILMVDLTTAGNHWALMEGYIKTIPFPHPLNITASWNLR